MFAIVSGRLAARRDKRLGRAGRKPATSAGLGSIIVRIRLNYNKTTNKTKLDNSYYHTNDNNNYSGPNCLGSKSNLSLDPRKPAASAGLGFAIISLTVSSH